MFYDRVQSVQNTGESCDMYDIEVSSDHSFVANGIVCHNSQGLEYPYIILPFINQFGRNMLQRNLLYTALTRAKEKVIVIGHGSAIEKAISNASVTRRNTKLGERIKTCYQQREKNSSSKQSSQPESSPAAPNQREPSLSHQTCSAQDSAMDSMFS